MDANPALGVLLHAIGGLAAASFYIPYKRVSGWAWETYWLVGGIFSWIVAPWAFSLAILPQTTEILRDTSRSTLFWTFFFGVLWGVGGLTFGLTMRYLGIALGYAIALGLCAAFGTLMPPLFNGELGEILSHVPGQIILLGVAVCVVGIAVSGRAGIRKESELSEADKKATVAEFSFGRGMAVAVACGVMSASMAYGIAAGKPIAAAALAHGAPSLWQNLPVLIVILTGGFLTNVVWCVFLAAKNRSVGDYARGERAPFRQLSALRPRGRHVVPAVLLLQHGHDADGAVRLLELDPPYGQHHHLRHAVGRRPPRVAGHDRRHPAAGGRRPRPADRVDRHRRLRQLPRGRALIGFRRTC